MKRFPCKTDIWILPQGTISVVRPLTEKASEWLTQHFQNDSHWCGPALVVQHQCLADLLNQMTESGLRVTQ